MKKLIVKKAKGLSTKEMNKIYGGRVGFGNDSRDCTSELASGGTTTDTYEIAYVNSNGNKGYFF